MTRRPAEILTGAIGSALALFIAFGVNLTDDQTAAILASVAWVPAIVTAVVKLWRSLRPLPEPQILASLEAKTAALYEDKLRAALEAPVNRPPRPATTTVGAIVEKKKRQPPVG